MGEVNATVGIWASDGAYLRNLRLKVDTGAAYSQLPAATLHDLGWAPTQPPPPRPPRRRHAHHRCPRRSQNPLQ